MRGGQGQGHLEPQRAKTTHTNGAGSQVEETLRARRCLRILKPKEVTLLSLREWRLVSREGLARGGGGRETKEGDRVEGDLCCERAICAHKENT